MMTVVFITESFDNKTELHVSVLLTIVDCNSFAVYALGTIYTAQNINQKSHVYILLSTWTVHVVVENQCLQFLKMRRMEMKSAKRSNKQYETVNFNHVKSWFNIEK